MVEHLIGRASVAVAASREILWEVLLRPQTPCQIMPVTEVLSAWSPGKPFLWKLDVQGKSYDLEGTVLRLEPDRLLEYEYRDPLDGQGRVPRRVEHHHRVTIELSDEEIGTRVSVSQDNNRTKAEHAHAEGGWRLALNNLKVLAEALQQERSAQGTRDE
jgi:uncharacterized protein YndB with AHSA1/START domain